VVRRILHSIRQLETFPELGTRWRSSETRALVVPGVPYRVHYQLTGSAVQIITITHTSRILEF
jgi:plasmid stabilization system protein ParE